MAVQPGDAECAPLTYRLADMLEQHAHGWTYAEIGDARGIKPETARAHLRQARLRLGADTLDQAIATASHLGIINLSEKRKPPRRPHHPAD